MRKRIGEAPALRQAVLIVVITALAPAAGLVAGCITSAGRGVESDYFVVAGSVGPLIGLALFIDITVVINDAVKEQGLTQGNKGLALVLAFSNAALLLTSAGLALYALGSGVRTTFLVTATVVPLVIQTLLLTESALFKVHAIKLADG
jgi:hypothetical protein